MNKRIWALLLAMAMLLSACSEEESSAQQESYPDELVLEVDREENAQQEDVVSNAQSDFFSDRDFESSYDESKSAIIQLNGDSASCSSDAVQISGSTVTITDEGSYIVRGTLNDGMIIVNSEKTDKTQIVLDGASIHSESSAALYILQSDKVFVTLAEGSENSLSNGGSFVAIDDNNIDAAIFSKEDVTFNGSGALSVSSPAGHGIVSKDSLTITGGSYEVSSASHGLCGKDDVCIADGSFQITSGKDGIHAENSDDESMGYVYVENGSFTIAAEGDGISAASTMQIENGQFDVISGGGSVNAAQQSSADWGNFMGGGRGGKGGKSGFGMSQNTATATEETDDDSTSIKGIKAGTELSINGGSFIIDSADDAFHSNGNVTINGGDFAIASGDDAFHADETLTITEGTVNISESYEGLEGLHVLVSGGKITLTSSDDGINAAGGTDASGTGGRDNGNFGRGGMGMGVSNGSIVISGGKLYINASGDGLDANGTLEISGGYTVVCGPTQGDTATLDYDTSAVISGGTFIGTGSSMMAQSFSASENQGLIAVSMGNQSAGTEIILKDAEGNTVLSHTPELSFAVVILSSPDIVEGQTYTLYVGENSGQFTAE